MAVPWWKSTVVYQVYPRSFADGSGDGIGDLPGLLDHLDHLAWLGVGALWLSPVYRSPMADFGYDVADHCAVDPVFGTLADLDAVIAAAHERGLRVMLDWVPNHTSDEHPWFVESRSSRTSDKRDWYVWRDSPPGGGPPNNWLSNFTDRSPAWTRDETTGQWYLHCYLPQQPDLNWDNPAVEAAMHDVLRFWLDRGVDGFRADVVHLIGKELDRDDDPRHVANGIPHTPLNDVAVTHERIRRIRRLLDRYPSEPPMVGEVWLLSTRRMATYYGQGDELHMSFNFPFVFAPWEAGALHERIDRTRAELDPIDAWPTWVLSNHDNPRVRTRYGGTLDRARAAAVLLLTLRGTPFLYQGDELGLLDAEVPVGARVDPGGRDGCRAPMPWTAEPPHGWPSGTWLPFGPDPAGTSVTAQESDPDSMLHLHRRLLHERRSSAALSHGSFAWLPAPEGVLAYERREGEDRRWVLVNTLSDRIDAVLPGLGTVVVATEKGVEQHPYSGYLGPDGAVVVRPS
ncbi:MAG TPA: alpha-amylase family glycosyl hydrolase [Acidimicrobiales bacterium]